MLGEWYHFKNRETKLILELVRSYDDNGDGVMQLDEYEGLLVHLEPSINKKDVLKLFKEATSMADGDNVDSI